MKRHLPIPRALDGQLSRFRLPGPLPQRHSHRELEPATYNAGLGHVLAQAWLLYRQAEASREEISRFGDTISEPGPLPS